MYDYLSHVLLYSLSVIAVIRYMAHWFNTTHIYTQVLQMIAKLLNSDLIN